MSVSLSQSDLEAIRQLLKLVTDNRLSELTVTLREGVTVTIRAGEPSAEPALVDYTDSAPRREGPASGRRPAPEAALPPPLPAAKRGAAVLSPMMGIFYASPAPGEPAFVQPGDEVAIGQTIGLIEAMKVFSEVPSDAEGRVLEVAAHDGDIVQLGQPLLYLESV